MHVTSNKLVHKVENLSNVIYAFRYSVFYSFMKFLDQENGLLGQTELVNLPEPSFVENAAARQHDFVNYSRNCTFR